MTDHMILLSDDKHHQTTLLITNDLPAIISRLFYPHYLITIISPISKMSLAAILTLLCSLLTFVLAANLQDKSDIKDLTAAFDLLIDGKKFDQLDKVLTPDVTYNPGCNNRPVQGLFAARNALLEIILSTATTYNTLGTQLITFFPLFAKNKCSNCAKFISYTTIAIFCSGNLTEEYTIFFARFMDKKIVWTREAGFGG